MKKFNCPSCGAQNSFLSNFSVYAVCGYCKSMVVRRDIDVELIGTMAQLPDDMSALQIGAEGVYDNQKFTIIGRMKVGWKKGFWNEWFLLMDNGRKGWICEAQGSYAISFELSFDESFSDSNKKNIQKFKYFEVESKDSDIKELLEKSPQSFKVGSSLSICNIDFKIADIKNAFCIGSEGELPFAAKPNRKALSIDFLGWKGEFASLEIIENQKRLYMGKYVEWDEMRLQNIRPLEGW